MKNRNPYAWPIAARPTPAPRAPTRPAGVCVPAFLRKCPQSNCYSPESNVPHSYSLDLSDLALGTNHLYHGQVLGPPRAHRHGGAGTKRSCRPIGTRSDQTSEPDSTYDPRAYPSRSYRGDRARGNGGHDARPHATVARPRQPP